MKKLLLFLGIAIVLALPVKLIWNYTEGATIRTTLISGNKAVKTTVAQNPSGYPGRGWVRNLTGSGSTALNRTNCEAATSRTASAGWVWFADANGNGTANDGEDGICVATTTNSFGLIGGTASWNGATNMVKTLASTTITDTGTASTLITSGLTANALVNSIVVFSGPGRYGWGVVKANDTVSVTVYGYWRAYNSYSATADIPQINDTFKIYDDYKYDNSWIGDYSCTGNFPNGAVVHNFYPPWPNPVSANATTSALEISDCLDGKRDLLPNESDRAVLSGTVTTMDTLVITDSSKDMPVGVWVGQKLLITSGTGVNSTSTIEDNTATTITVSSWSGTAPDVGSTYSVIYIVPHASYVTGTAKIFSGDDTKANKGPLTTHVLDNWKGTHLPSFHDFFGFCGAKSGTSYNTTGDKYYYSSGASSIKALGNYGSHAGRGVNPAPYNNYLNYSNSGSWEWLSEQGSYYSARIAGHNACSYVTNNSVSYSYRFRAVFRP